MSAHEFSSSNGYHCDVCGCAYHCSVCNEGSSMMGHSVRDDDGWFFHCQEPERWERLKAKWAAERAS